MKVVRPLKVYHHKRFYGPTLTGGSSVPHLRNLNVSHSGIVEAAELKFMAPWPLSVA
jgi:hypothetical protein